MFSTPPNATSATFSPRGDADANRNRLRLHAVLKGMLTDNAGTVHLPLWWTPSPHLSERTRSSQSGHDVVVEQRRSEFAGRELSRCYWYLRFVWEAML